MALLSTKENTELKKLTRKLKIEESAITIEIPRQVVVHKTKIKKLKKQISEIKRIEQKKKVQVEMEDLEGVREKIKKMRKNEKHKLEIIMRVKEAEMLILHSNGILPPSTWLHHHKFNGLSKCIESNPGAFKNIKQNRRQKTIQEHIRTAIKLVKKNGGMLPHALALRETGHISLTICMKKYPNMFRDIPQRKVQKNSDEWKVIAEQLLKEKNGIFPTANELSMTGMGGLVYSMRRNPEKFEKFKKATRVPKIKTVDEHLEYAKKLIEENNGVLPAASVLQLNHQALDGCMRRHPERFREIKKKQELKRKVKIEND